MTQITDNLSFTSSWVKFFTESGIPQSVAANYAVTFVDNRITKQMLLDLNKEILFDMGITVMGDIIAILKHAKIVHAQLTREKVFKNELSMVSVPPARRAVPAIARVSASEDVKPRITTEIKSQEIISTTRKLPIKRKLDSESAPVKKLKVVKVATSAANRGSAVILKTNTLNKSSVNIDKPSVFERLASTNETFDFNSDTAASNKSKQSTGFIRRPIVAENHSTGSSVFDRLGPQLESKLPQIKSSQANPVTKFSVMANVAPPIRKKIVYSDAPTNSAAQVSKKIIRLSNPSNSTVRFGTVTSTSPAIKKQSILNRIGTKNTFIKIPNSSAGLFAAESTMSKTDSIQSRIGVNVRNSNQSFVGIPKKRINFSQDERKGIVLKTLLDKNKPGLAGSGNVSRKFVGNVSGSVFNRLG